MNRRSDGSDDIKSIARRHRDDGPARTQTGREVGVYAPGTSKTDRAGNGSQLFSWGRAVSGLACRCAPTFSQGMQSRCGVAAVPSRLFAPVVVVGTNVHFAKGGISLARYEFAPRHVIDARYLGDYKVWLEFNDGRKGVVDLSDELHGEELEPLRNRDRFSEFYLDYGLASIAWLDGQDFTPEFLYDKLKAMN